MVFSFTTGFTVRTKGLTEEAPGTKLHTLYSDVMYCSPENNEMDKVAGAT